MSFKTEEKGSIIDVLLIPLLLLGLVLSVLVSWTILDKFGDATTADQFPHDNIVKGKTALQVFDGGIMVLILGLIGGAVLLASQIRTHPAFAIPAILFLAIALMIGANYAHITKKIMEHEGLVEASDSFPLMKTIADNLPLIMLGAGVIIMIVLFAKPGGESYGSVPY